MTEYIEREAAIAEEEYDGNFVLVVPVKKIRNIPAADVTTVRHGRWEVVVGSDGKEHMVCTECRKQQDLTGVFSYCPNCGCLMDGGDDE